MEPLPEIVSTLENKEQTLLQEIAESANVDSWKDLRWFAIGGDKPRAIVVVTRGKKPKRVLTISKGIDANAWDSWQPVLEQLHTERAKTNKRRVSHNNLPTGVI